MEYRNIKKAGYSQPGMADVHVDRPLTNLSIAFMQSAEAYVASRVFPEVGVDKVSDKYFTIPRGAFFRDEFKKLAPGEKTQKWNWQVSTDSYLADEWGLGAVIADQIRANYDSPLDPDREAMQGLTQMGLISKERQWASAFFATSVWTGDQTGVAGAPGANQFRQWNDATSTPVHDMRRFIRTVHARTGFKPNKLVLGKEVYDELLDHPEIINRLNRGQTSGPAMANKDDLARLFELEEILVMEAIYNSGPQGGTDSFGYIGGKSALLVYVPPRPGLMTPSAGYTFGWRGLLGSGSSLAFRRLRLEEERSWVVEAHMAYDLKKVSADLGLFMATCIA